MTGVVTNLAETGASASTISVSWTAPLPDAPATANIHIGLSAWTASTVYATVGKRVNRNNTAYELIASGTSGTTGPTGTGSSIVDGSATWKWLSAVDYTSLTTWGASIPSPTTQPLIGLLWNDGEITTSVGVPFLVLNNNASTAANPITLQCAPGESFRDKLIGQTTPLTYNAANGVAIRCPTGVSSIAGYFNIANSFVTIDGIQFISADPASTTSIVSLGPSAVLSNCLLDGYSQPGVIWGQDASTLLWSSWNGSAWSAGTSLPTGAGPVVTPVNNGAIKDASGNTWTVSSVGDILENGVLNPGGSNTSKLTYVSDGVLASQSGIVRNCVFIERCAGTYNATIGGSGVLSMVNNTFVMTSPSVNMTAYTTAALSGSGLFRNNIVIGYGGTPVGNTGVSGPTYAVDHCLFTNATNGWMATAGNTDGGGNLYGRTAANQFISASNDFRLKATSEALNAGVNDPTDIPSADDIARTARPQGTVWDIGAWEYKILGGPRLVISD